MNKFKTKKPAWPTKGQKPNVDYRTSEEKLKMEQEKLKAIAKKYAADCESSEEEEQLESDSIINKVLKQYRIDGKCNDIGRTTNFLEEAFQSGALTCLICISSIKRNEAVWNCDECFCCFHMVCIQRWSKDTISQRKLALEANVQYRRIDIHWCCPKCRTIYPPDYIPHIYHCFCKKFINPTYEPLIVPHSCGNICAKSLKPDCGHKCVLLCHPGPCPPCPKTIESKCFCGTARPKLQRCTNKAWCCNTICGKILTCTKHKCADICHPGDCRPCTKKSLQRCLCGNAINLRECASPLWQCEKICGNALTCGYHKCEERCHSGKCVECSRSKPRTCPCGKSSFELECFEDVPTCGDSCNKLLDCGDHICNQRCHKGRCDTCLERITKSCRCGQHRKEVQCGKPYLCDAKCKEMRDCGKHLCNRKCCDGSCSPCEKLCGKTLSCKKHSCASVCHQGPCFPCNSTEKLSCFCGGTILTVPCGKKGRTQPPKCNISCKIAPDCHHTQRINHKCHFGDCPPCAQICEQKYEHCDHTCVARCHSSVLIKLATPRAATPWEERGPQIQKQCLPCPPCKIPVPITCFGGHETCPFPCHIARPNSCFRQCGRQLACGNHTCTIPCHTIENAKDSLSAGSNCKVCDDGCGKPRIKGCTHPCPQPCHTGECPPCKSMFRIACHCGLAQPYVNCHEWTTTEDKELLQSCGNQCPLNFPCGHRCRINCHSGTCPNSEQCKKKVKVFCECRRIKKEHPCDVVRAGRVVVQCDDECKLKQVEALALRMEQALLQQKQQDERNQREVEKFEKIFAKKKNREKRTVQKHISSKNHVYFIVFSICALLLAVVIYFLFNSN